MAKETDKELKTNAAVCIFVLALFLAFIIGAWIESTFVAILIIVTGLYWAMRVVFGTSSTKTATISATVYRPDGTGAQTLGETEYFCKIAGVAHHNKSEGAFIGVVTNDPDNEYDKKAIAIYRNDGKLIGYIPRNEQRDFRKWSDRDPLPCVGYVRYGDYVDMYGSVKVIDADQRLTELHIMKFVRWLIENYGADFIPNDFTVDSATPPKTKEEWLDYLDEYIAQH